jgi:predicted ABC-type ATPase
MPSRPRLVIIGGPNGAGKTTLSVRIAAAWGLTYLGADQVAAERGLGSTGQDAIRAARLFSRRVAEALARRESTLIESTLSGLSTKHLLASFRRAGYDITVVLVFVDSPEICIARIRTRVARGGHFVPDDDVRRRFGRSLWNFWHHYRLQGHRWQLHYNGLEGLIETARGEAEMIEILDSAAFGIFERLVERKP